MPESLREKQVRFLKKRRMLEEYAESLGYELTLGDAFRDDRVHGVLGVKMGYGHKNSCHKLRLAQDYNLFLAGRWLDKTSDFEPLGVYWETLDDDARWGGRFGDGNHFSFEHNGFK